MQWEDLGFGNTWTQVLSPALQVLCGYLPVTSEPESWETGNDSKCYSPSPELRLRVIMARGCLKTGR